VTINRASVDLGLLLQAAAGDAEGKTDGQLLEQFLARRDEAAFAALVRRHGPMVLGVCRRILDNAADADDAFQAAFLVLVRRAVSLTGRRVLGDWLHGVARRTALKARSAAARRRAKEQAMARPEAQGADARDDWLPLLDEELARLAEKYRLPIVLCDLEGRTRREAAERLGWPEGTVAGRLARGRALLAKRLARHGLAPAAGALGAALSQKAAPACVPPALLASTVRAASLLAVGQAVPGVIPAQVAGLTEGVVRSMILSNLRTVAVAALVGVLGAAAITCAVLAGGQGGRAGPGAEAAPKPAGEKLSARISVKSKLPLRTETLDADLVLTNDGDKPLRVGLLCGEWQALWTAEGVMTYQTTFRPDLFKSDPPTEEQHVKNIVTLEPGDTAALPMPVTAAMVRAAGQKLRLAAAYEVGEEFAGKHRTWAGRVEAKPVLLTLRGEEEPAADDLNKLRGTWRLVSLENDGLRFGEGRPEIEGGKAVVAGTTLTLVDKDGRRALEFRLDPTKTPKEIRLTTATNELLRGIYEVDGDSFRLCFVKDGQGKVPAAFTADAGSKRWLYTFRRDPPAKEDKPKDGGAEKPKGKPLSLLAEPDSWEGKPYVKVYVSNPAGVALELTDRRAPPFDISMLCTVKVDGTEATALSDGDFTLGPAQKKELPADSKTLLGLLTFDRKVAAHFGGYTPVVYLKRNDSLDPLGRGKHRLEIGTKGTTFPTPVTPATIEVDLGPGE
jgi:RNA polymerase sigma factor (sigma-70 family)